VFEGDWGPILEVTEPSVLMAIFGSDSLRIRVLFPTSVLMGATIVAMVYAAVELHVGDLGEERGRRGVLIAETVERGVRGLMMDKDLVQIQALLHAMAAHRTDVESVTVIRPDGVAKYSSHPQKMGKKLWGTSALHKNVVGRSSYIKGTGEDVVVRPIETAPGCWGCHDSRFKVLGYLDVRLSRRPLADAEWRLTKHLARAGIPAFLLLVVGSWWLFSREAIRPIRRLAAAMRRAEGGDNHATADEGRPDEIGVAARCFNNTMKALRKSRAELEAFYQEGMERADRFATMGEVATGLAHEIKNPLAGLSGALEVLEEEVKEEGIADPEIVEEMKHQVIRLARTMDSLLDYARPARVRLKSTDVNATLGKVLFLVRQQIRSRRLKIELIEALSPQLPQALADPGQIEQVFLNLCLNAVQAMGDEAGILTLRTRCEAEQIVVEVSDTGPGISAEVGRSLFKPFFTTRKDGNGLGLPTSHRIVSDHGGSIDWRSVEGEGATFIVTLRRAAAGEQV